MKSPKRFPLTRCARSLGALTLSAVLFGAATTAEAATTFEYPLKDPGTGNVTSSGVVGIAGVLDNTQISNSDLEATLVAQNLLNGDPSAPSSLYWEFDARFYRLNTSEDYQEPDDFSLLAKTNIPENSGTTPSLPNAYGTIYDSIYVEAGPAYALGKYDGKNAGWILFALDVDEDSYIPAFPQDFWGKPDQDEAGRHLG